MANRGLFAEGFTADRLEKVYGGTKVLRNVDIWETKARKKKVSEIDTLVLFGDRAIVLQSKSKKLTLAARKGNDLQLQSDFRGAVQDACDQAMLCSEHLIRNSAIFTGSDGNEIAIPLAQTSLSCLCCIGSLSRSQLSVLGSFFPTRRRVPSKFRSCATCSSSTSLLSFSKRHCGF